MTIQKLVEHQKKAFRREEVSSLSKRKESLINLKKLLQENEREICAAIHEDFGKPYFEAYTSEIATILHEIDHHLKHLDKWAKPDQVGNSIFTFPSKNTVYKKPFGTVLIIGAWNYPIHLTFSLWSVHFQPE